MIGYSNNFRYNFLKTIELIYFNFQTSYIGKMGTSYIQNINNGLKFNNLTVFLIACFVAHIIIDKYHKTVTKQGFS